MAKGVPDHGLSKTPEYFAWRHARARCTNPAHRQWADYGGRGITMCERWRVSFMAFLGDVGPKPSPRHVLDRIDNDKGYKPGNCRWATHLASSLNRRSVHRIRLEGRTMSLAEWCAEKNLPYPTIRQRLKQGWSPAKALNVPLQKRPWREGSSA